MMKLIIPLITLAVIMVCEDDPINPELLEENPINLSGNWTLEKVYQNEIDITAEFDFNSFNLALNYSGEFPSTFSVTANHSIPFVTQMTDGNWTFDNPVYPSRILFIQGDTVSSIIAEPLLPKENSQLKMEFDLSCDENIYVYHFSKNE
jgi:hypothetical protein